MPDPLKWRRRLALLVYNLLLPFGLLLLLPGSILKMRRRGGYGRDFWQRFAVYRREFKRAMAAGPRPLWMHAVSVGEVGVARKLIDAILALEPERRIVLSTTTSTGHAVALDKAPSQLLVIYNPVDLFFTAWRALRVIRPERLILVEAEVWPNLAALAKRRKVPLCLVNARLSPRSERRYRRFKWFAETVFSLLDKITVQFPEDVDRWAGIGVPRERIVLTGSVKYDQPPVAESPRVGEFRKLLESLWGKPLPPMFLGASTFPGEEPALGRVLLELRGQLPNLKAILVPRHFERSPEAKAELEALGLSVALRTNGVATPADVFLVNTTGELRDWQALPDVVVIGKSFLATGGQNPVEAIAAGTPVITGPHMENFESVMKLLLAADGITKTDGLETLPAALSGHLSDIESARARAERGRATLAQHRGAAERNAKVIAELNLPAAPP